MTPSQNSAGNTRPKGIYEHLWGRRQSRTEKRARFLCLQFAAQYIFCSSLFPSFTSIFRLAEEIERSGGGKRNRERGGEGRVENQQAVLAKTAERKKRFRQRNERLPRGQALARVSSKHFIARRRRDLNRLEGAERRTRRWDVLQGPFIPFIWPIFDCETLGSISQVYISGIRGASLGKLLRH